MPKFDSGSDVEALDYDLKVALKATPFVEDEQAVGQVPEPPQEVIVAYLEGIGDIKLEEREFSGKLARGRADRAKARWSAKNDGKEPPEDATFTAGELREVYAEDRDEREAFRIYLRARYIDVIAEACSGLPRRELLEALPERHLQGFAGWLTGMFSPEALAAGIYG